MTSSKHQTRSFRLVADGTLLTAYSAKLVHVYCACWQRTKRRRPPSGAQAASSALPVGVCWELAQFLGRDFIFYDSLGVQDDATPQEVRKACRRQLLHYHPDIAGYGSEAKFRHYSAISGILGNLPSRVAYDTYGAELFDVPPLGAAPRRVVAAERVEDDAEAQEPTADALPEHPQPVAPGQPTRLYVTVSPAAVRSGTSLSVRLVRWACCLSCHGSGCQAGGLVLPCPRCRAPPEAGASPAPCVVSGTGGSSAYNPGFVPRGRAGEECNVCCSRRRLVHASVRCTACRGGGAVAERAEVVVPVGPSGAATGVTVIPAAGGYLAEDGSVADLVVEWHEEGHTPHPEPALLLPPPNYPFQPPVVGGDAEGGSRRNHWPVLLLPPAPSML